MIGKYTIICLGTVMVIGGILGWRLGFVGIPISFLVGAIAGWVGYTLDNR